MELFNLGFFENYVLAHDRVIFAEFHLFSRVARVLFGYVIKPCFSSADKFDKYGAWLRHCFSPTNK